MRKLAVTFGSLTNEQLEKIKNIAIGYAVISMKSDSVQIMECEIVFGGINSTFLHQATNLKWLHTHFAGVDALLKPEVKFPKKHHLNKFSWSIWDGDFGVFANCNLDVNEKKS